MPRAHRGERTDPTRATILNIAFDQVAAIQIISTYLSSFAICRFSFRYRYQNPLTNFLVSEK
jgi:hypothetical protein